MQQSNSFSHEKSLGKSVRAFTGDLHRQIDDRHLFLNQLKKTRGADCDNAVSRIGAKNYSRVNQKRLGTFLYLVSALLIVLASAGFSTCLAATYYVDNAATGQNNGSSWTDAWKSFAAINWNGIAAGDTIYISGGGSSKIYTESLVIGKSGASGKIITITKGKDAGHNGEVIIDGRKSRGILVDVLNRSYVTISNLSLRNPLVGDGGRAIRLKGCRHITIDNNTVTSSVRAGVFIENSTNCIISRNRISTDARVSAQTDGIYSQRNSGIIFDGNHIVINNSDPSGHNDCLQSYLDTDLIIRNNYGEQNNKKTINAQGIYLTNSYGTIQIYNNVINAPSTYNSLIAIRLPKAGVRGIVVSNTMIGGKYGSLRVEGDRAAVIKNNIVWKCNNGVALTYNGDRGNVANNIFDSDPMLDANWVPKSGSPAVDKGANLDTSYCIDKNGIARPEGGGFDIGAYEVKSGQNQLQPPPNFRISAR